MFLDHFLQTGPLSPECQQVHSAKSSRIREHPTKKTADSQGHYCFLILNDVCVCVFKNKK